jgi:hypothetical protein
MRTFVDITASIAKLLRLLASDKPGEIVASVHALQRVLRSAELDLHDLANVIEGRALRIAPIPTPAGNDNVLAMIRCLYRQTGQLTSKELEFLYSISDWCREPTIHQMRILRRLHKRCSEVQVRS